MEYLNGLSFVRKTTLDWHKMSAIISNTLKCEYISIESVDRMEECMYVYFTITDKSKKDEIKDALYRFCDNLDINTLNVFDEIDTACDHSEPNYELDIDKEIYLNIICKYLNEAYDLNIKVIDAEACYDNVGVLFEIQ